MQILELSKRDYKIITVKVIEKMGHMCEDMGNFSGEMKTLKKN